MDVKLDRFTTAYIECALWSSTDEDGDSLDGQYDITDLSPEAIASIVEDCKDFQEAQANLLAQASELSSHNPEWSYEEQAGHDFWLTRNRHGAGFWDRGLGEVGRKLTEATHVYGSSDLYVGDDGKIHVQ